MVGKSNQPRDAELRPGLFGVANPTEGLDALDQVREASMADEGGASGAVMESEARFATPAARTKTAEWRTRGIGIAISCGVGLALAGIVLRRRG